MHFRLISNVHTKKAAHPPEIPAPTQCFTLAKQCYRNDNPICLDLFYCGTSVYSVWFSCHFSKSSSVNIHGHTQTQSVNIYPCTYLQSLGCSGAEWWLGSVWVVVVDVLLLMVLVCNSVL